MNKNDGINKVIKRDGTFEDFSSNKIMLMINWACDKKNVSPCVLYDKFSNFIVDNMPTKVIQDQLVKVALTLTSTEEPEWADVAGNLLLLNVYKNHKEYMRNNSFGYSNLYDFLVSANNDNLYDKDILSLYTKDEIDKLGLEIDISYDQFDYSGINLLDKRFLVQYNRKSIEPPQFMYMITAMATFKNQEDKIERLENIISGYHLSASQKVSPATPNLSNLRKYGRGSSPSCYILKVEDNLESIYDTAKKAAVISKNGGASGISCSSIRANGSYIQGVKGLAKGVIPWIKIYNDTANAVDQLG